MRTVTPRRIDEEHRSATPLELFMDLCFVVAVAQLASSFHHSIADNDIGHALLAYPMVFFAIWWAWMNFTWYASAYDNDDVFYRLAVFVQIIGVVVLGAGIPRGFESFDFRVMVVGYVIMRLALAAQWVRAMSDEPRRKTALRYALSVSILQIGWICALFLPEAVFPAVIVSLVILELLGPFWAERAGQTPWHPGHIAERYGLFTIIVLGESILGTALAVQAALDGGAEVSGLIWTGLGGILIVFTMWWIYFAQPDAEYISDLRQNEFQGLIGFLWGYGHYFIFAAAAAVGAGIAVVVDQNDDHAEIGQVGAALSVAIPVVIYLLVIWLLHFRAHTSSVSRVVPPISMALILLAGLAGMPIIVIGIIMAGSIAISLAGGPIEHRPLLAE